MSDICAPDHARVISQQRLGPVRFRDGINPGVDDAAILSVLEEVITMH